MDPKVMQLGLKPMYTPTGRVFAISDVHNEAKKLKILWSKIKQVIKEEDHLVFCGDYVDAGPNAPETLKVLQQIKNEHANTFFIMGNHDQMLLEAMAGQSQAWFAWYVNGGTITIKHFENLKIGIVNPPDIRAWLEFEKITFLDNLIPYYETEHLVITHAPVPTNLFTFGVEDGGVLEELGSDIRWRFTDHEKREVSKIPKLFVCGHQNGFGRVKAPRLYPEVNRIFLDSGAGYYFDAPISCVIVYPFDKIKTILSEGKT